MKSTQSSIRNSIQQLKEKLQMDKIQLQNIRSELNRSKSPILKQRQNSNKENESYISNASKYRNSVQGQRPQQLELKRQHRRQMSATIENYQCKLKQLASKHELDIQMIRDHYQEAIRDKNAYIEVLEGAISEVECEPETPRTPRLNEIHQIKDHYQRIIKQVKEKYESIIQTLSEQNQELKHQNSQLKNITFKGPGSLLGHARQTLTKYVNSQSNSSRAQFSTSHIEYNSNSSANNRMRESIIDSSQRLSVVFGNKFKFKKSQLFKHGSSVSIYVDEYSSNNTNWRERSVYEEHPKPLPTVQEKQVRTSMIANQ